VLGQHSGDIRSEIGGVVEIFDVGPVDPEDVVDPDSREVSDDVVDHPVFARHTSDTTRERLGFTRSRDEPNNVGPRVMGGTRE
jgi:hypothetical protein